MKTAAYPVPESNDREFRHMNLQGKDLEDKILKIQERIYATKKSVSASRNSIVLNKLFFFLGG